MKKMKKFKLPDNFSNTKGPTVSYKKATKDVTKVK